MLTAGILFTPVSSQRGAKNPVLDSLHSPTSLEPTAPGVTTSTVRKTLFQVKSEPVEYSWLELPRNSVSAAGIEAQTMGGAVARIVRGISIEKRVAVSASQMSTVGVFENG